MLDSRPDGEALKACEPFTGLDELDSECVAFGLEAVAFGCQFGVVGLDPAQSVLFAFEFSAGLIAFTADLFDRRVGGVDLCRGPSSDATVTQRDATCSTVVHDVWPQIQRARGGRVGRGPVGL